MRWLDEAIELQELQNREFWDRRQGGYFFVGENTSVVLAREKPRYDGAEPSGNSVSALNLLRLEQLTGKSEYRNLAVKLFQNFSQSMTVYTRRVPKMLTALDYFHDQVVSVVLVAPVEAGEDPLSSIAGSVFLPNHAFMTVVEKDVPELEKRFPILLNKRVRNERPTAYVCRGVVCSAPIVDPARLRAELSVVTSYEVPVAQP